MYGTLSEFKGCLCWSTIELTRMAPNLVYHLPSLIVPKVLGSRSLVLLPVLFDIFVFSRSRLLLPVPLPIFIARSARRPLWLWALQWVQTYSGFRFSSFPIAPWLIVHVWFGTIDVSIVWPMLRLFTVVLYCLCILQPRREYDLFLWRWK